MIFKNDVIIENDLTVAETLAVSSGKINLSGVGRITGVDTVTSSTDAANKAYVDATVSGASHLPDIWRVDDASDLDTNDTTLACSTLQIVTGADSTAASGSVAGEVEIIDAGTYEISYSVSIKVPTGVSTRQVVAMYLVSNSAAVPGSLNATYLRLPGSNQGGFASVSGSGYVTAGAEDTSVGLVIGWLDGTDKSVDIYEAAGIQNTLTFRRIS